MSRYIILFQFRGVEHGERGLQTARIAFHLKINQGMNKFGLTTWGCVLLDERFEKTRFRRSVESQYGKIEIADDGSEVRVIEDIVIQEAEFLAEEQIHEKCMKRLQQLCVLLRRDLEKRYELTGMGWDTSIEDSV